MASVPIYICAGGSGEWKFPEEEEETMEMWWMQTKEKSEEKTELYQVNWYFEYEIIRTL